MATISERYAQYTPLRNDLEIVTKDTTDLMALKRRCELLISSARPYVQVRREAVEAVEAGRKMPGSMVFWMLSAFVVGIMVAYLREYLDTSISSEYDVRRHLNLPVFGIVPYIDGERLSMRLEPNSSLGEMFNAAATLIRTALLEGGYNCIAVCSANPQEGKTTVSVNLATAFARKGLRTLLIDGDMRRPEVHNMLKLDNSRGLSGVLDGRLKVMGLTPADSAAKEERPMSFNQIFMGCEVENLYVLPSGPLPASAATLIETARFEQLLSEARKAMDIVILDTPPICTVSDALTLTTKVDANIFVVGAGMSEQRDVTWAKHLLANVHARMLGVILTMSRKRARVEYYYYYGDQKKVREQI
ncbi:MAG: P-loop NTPase [Planctomycetota bacterium]|nr:P-loop NTPase [Planctomycetota bacterium]